MTHASISQDDVKHVAKLARLELNDTEVQQLATDLSNILGLVETLNELDLEGVSDTPQTSQPALYRADEQRHVYDRAHLMRNAPEVDGQFFRVPKILD